MKKFSKLALAALIAATAVTGAACSKEETKPAASTSGTTEKKEDKSQINRAVLAAAMIAEEKFESKFSKKTGLDEAGKEVAVIVAGDKAKTVDALTNFWGKEAAEKAYDAVIDTAGLEAANKLLQAKVNKDNEGKAEDKKAKFTPATAVAKKEYNVNLRSANPKFEDVKVEEKDGKFHLEYKGLKYTLEKSGVSYKVVAKEGTLAK